MAKQKENLQWANTAPAIMIDAEVYEYECRGKDGNAHLHRITTDVPVNSSGEKKKCAYCGRMLRRVRFEKEEVVDRAKAKKAKKAAKAAGLAAGFSDPMDKLKSDIESMGKKAA